MRYSLPLAANVPTAVRFKGKNITVMDTGAAAEVDLTLNAASQQDEENFGLIGRNFSIYSPAVDFTGATFLSTVPTTVEFIVTNYKIETLDGTTLNATISAVSLPLPVENEQAAALTNNAAVACSAVIAQVAAANAARRSLRFYNAGASPVALGAAGLTWAKRTIVLEAGDLYVEDRAANLAWHAICDAGLTASVIAQEVTT